MKTELLRKVVGLAGVVGHIFVATADERGTPHVAAAGKLSSPGTDRLAVEAWFCPGTMENLRRNKNASVVVWDPMADVGYQIIGELERIEDVAILDGCAPEVEKKTPTPQVDRRLVVRVQKVIRFSHAPHSDLEE